MENIKEFFNEKAENWNKNEKATKEELRECLSIIPINKGDKVLDLACGTGIISELLFERTKCTVRAIDLSDKMIEIAKKTHDVNNIKFECINFYDYIGDEFDAIVCFNAFPHFLDVEKFVEKAQKLIKKDGILVIMHNMGRESLDKHHDAFAKNVSRHLKSPKEEYVAFSNSFYLEDSLDSKDKYYMILRKK